MLPPLIDNRDIRVAFHLPFSLDAVLLGDVSIVHIMNRQNSHYYLTYVYKLLLNAKERFINI